jgi:PAS domain S-box-containing protein
MNEHGHDTLSDVPVEQLIRAADYFQYLPGPVMAFDPQDILVACNRAAAHLHGCDSEEVIGSHLFLYFPPEAADALACAIEATRSNGAWQGQLPILAAGYTVRIADVRMVAVGGTVAMMYTDVTDHERTSQATREAIRWAAIRDTALAAIDSLTSPLPAWADQVRRFAAGSSSAFGSTIDQGAGSTVLVAGFGPMVRKVLEAFLERCDYLTVSAEYPQEAAELLRRHGNRIRAAVLGPETSSDTLHELRRYRPLLPAVTIGWERSIATALPYPVEPADLIRGVAEAVATDFWNESLVDEPVEQQEFMVSSRVVG